MPTRFLKETICTSESLAQLSAEAERFWYRLVVQCDDFGRFDARPTVLRARCFSLLLDRISENDVRGWLTELETAGLIFVYAVNGKPYLVIPNFTVHNTPRAKSSRWPAPEASDGIPVPATTNTCKQMQADAGGCKQIPSYAKTESYAKTMTETDDAAPRPLDPAWGAAMRSFENEIGMVSGSILPEMTDMWDVLTSNGTPGWWQQAITVAVAANKRSWSYVSGILSHCMAEGHPPSRNGTKPGPTTSGTKKMRVIIDGIEEEREVITHG